MQIFYGLTHKGWRSVFYRQPAKLHAIYPSECTWIIPGTEYLKLYPED